jgi:hypothetical protein
LQVRWDWQDDGVFDTSWSTSKKISHIFGGGYGGRTIRFEVKDPEGLTDSTTKSILIDNPPIAIFTVDPSGGDTNTVFHFDGSNSSDPDFGDPWVDVRWDWQDDGIYDTGWNNNKTIDHVFPYSGTYAVRMQVKAGSLTDSATRIITVNQGESSSHLYMPVVIH